MKRLFLILIIAMSACTGGIGPKETCSLQYSSDGVVMSQLKPDYAKAYVDGNVRYSVEVTNLGEKRASNVRLKCTDESELSCPATPLFNDAPFTLNPPDTTACIEGEVKQDQTIVTAKMPTGEEPAYFKVKLSYDYSSLSWAEVTLLSEAQWKIRTQQGIKPVQSAYQSASPIKIALGVPDAPVVYSPGGTNEFPITVILKNIVEGYTYPETSSGKKNKVDKVTLTAPNGLAFVSDKCTEGAAETQTCTLTQVPITIEDDTPKSTVVKAKITNPVTEEETYKITANAEYTYVVNYASPQGVEIKSEPST